MHLILKFLHRGEESRKDFKGLSSVRAFFPKVPVVALAATTPPHLLIKLKHSLSLKSNCKTVKGNPNRLNKYFDKKMCMGNHYATESYDSILTPKRKYKEKGIQ